MSPRQCQRCGDLFQPKRNTQRFCPKKCTPEFRPIIERLQERRIITQNDCWEWQGAKMNGYGQIRVGNRTRLVSHVAYEAFVGQLRQGECVLHKCDNPPCFNPSHLWVGSHADNVADKMRKGRYVLPPSGEQNPNAKLTNQQATQIRQMALQGASRRSIANLFGVAHCTVSEIIRGRSYKNAVT
jgi:hypothetical protein